MKIPLNWLREYVDVPSDVEELTQKLTAIGHMQDKKPEKVGDDVVIDLEVRQNRPDCLSILGIAREVAAVTGKNLRVQSTEYPSTSLRTGALQSTNGKDTLHIENTAPELCRRFKALRIRCKVQGTGYKVPGWMTERLTAYGIKSISPIVDITNYVMIELGEPLHAFDIRHIENSTIDIRRAKEGERLSILGGKVLSLTTEDLVIASTSKPLSLAGMIGGADSGVHPDTTEIVLEAATYNQASVRRSSIRHSVRTEASTRHEKFLHPHLAEVALERAANLILEICGGEIVAPADSYPNPVKELAVDLRLTEIGRLGGVAISLNDAEIYLKYLGFTVVRISSLELRVSVPYWRTDIEQEADLVEEVLRLYGFENIPASLPPFPSPKNITSYWFTLEEKIRDSMLQLGFDEQITEPLTKNSTEYGVRSTKSTQIILQNALNADKNALRISLKKGLVHALDYQKKFGKESVKLFELGKVYGETGDKKAPYFEARQLGCIMYDVSAQRETLYLNAKGTVETLCRSLGFDFSDEIYSIQLLDEITVFCTVEIEKHWGPDANKLTPKKQLYSGIPNFQKFDISMVLHKKVPVGRVIALLRSKFPDIHSISLGETPKSRDAENQSVLLRFVMSEKKIPSRDLIQNISQILDSTMNIKVR